jgi:hypothetical protein
MTQLHRYLSRLHDTLVSRREITIEFLEIFDRSNYANQSSEFYARLRFPDGSTLEIVAKLTIEQFLIRKTRYVYHCQTADNQLIFRYDNAPHHPQISTHPHHKHVGDQIIAATPPDLSDVLREIDNYLYAQQRGKL